MKLHAVTLSECEVDIESEVPRWRRFYGSHDPTDSVIALKDDG